MLIGVGSIIGVLCKLIGSLGILAPSITDPARWNVTSLAVKELVQEVERYQLDIIGWAKWLSMVKSIQLVLGYSQAPSWALKNLEG